ncbi:ficolin-1-A-like, partial [Argopecten irradians]|uniref:ficolin-1-A-like n=1 Tax=Argopecten irradians TaxID=31199 RepID=UPI0037174FCD
IRPCCKIIVNLCRRCCESDLCNDRCTENELTTTTSALTTTTSTTQTTPTSTATTTLTARIYRNCDEYYRAGSVKSGIYTISPDDVNTFDVYCDMEDGDGGWIVLQHRFNGSVLFNRSFSDYENGFGQLDGEFWLGLSKMYLLTNSNRIVRFNLQTLTGTWLTLEYGTFSVASNRTQYTLHVANHIKGFGAQTFEYNSGNEFSTIDRDNGNSCAKRRFGGWWYKSCTYLNINGEFGLADNESGVMEHYTYNYIEDLT